MREMKDSGIKWIGEIPMNWNVVGLKKNVEFINGYAFDSGDFYLEGKYTVIRIGDINNGLVNFEDAQKCNSDEQFLDRYRIKDDDVLIAMSGATVGKLGYVSGLKNIAFANQRVGILRSHDARFLYYSLSTDGFLEYIKLTAGGTAQPNISTSNIKNYLLPFPDLFVRESITAYLDQKVSLIDNIIEKTKQSIEEYKKLKQSIITEAVTKGLNPDVKMKDSGIEWIGLIPEHWEVIPIKYLLRVKSEKNMPNEQVLSLYRDYGVIPKDSRDDNHNVTSLDTGSYKFVEIGNFVINKMKAWQGSMALSNFQGVISPAYHVFEFTNILVEKRYIHYLLRNQLYLPEYLRLSTGMRIGQWDLGVDDFRNLPFIKPTIKEQVEIIQFIEAKIAIIDKFVESKDRLLIELESYKKSLIYEVVTGKKEIA